MRDRMLAMLSRTVMPEPNHEGEAAVAGDEG